MNVDTLAQIIRRVDGDNTMGAGELAEAIVEALDLTSAKAHIVALTAKVEEAEKVCDSYADENQRLSDRAETAEAQLEKYKEALTPSGNTKAEYSGEFTMGVTVTLGHEEETRRVMIPWTTVKEIMAAIRERATTDHD